MFLNIKLAATALLIFFLGEANTVNDTIAGKNELAAKALYPIGRYIMDKEQNLELISSAVHFGFTFKGKECKIFATLPTWLNHNYLQYELDGTYQKKVKITQGSDSPLVIHATSGGMHTVWVYKATEAHTGAIIIKKITGKNIKALPVQRAPVIEFIGNSITCGAAADPSEVPCGTGSYHDQHNAYYAYGPRVARALNANYVLSSVSGIGVYRNWNSDAPTMPQVYGQTDFQDKNSTPWDFSSFTPQIVSIALGTNDFSNGDGIKKRLPFDSAAFVNSYISFVQLVKSKYPAARIALLSSAMVNGNNRVLLQNCLTAVQQKINEKFIGDKPVATFFFEPMQAHGCGGHPNVEDHAILAKELEPFFKQLMKK